MTIPLMTMRQGILLDTCILLPLSDVRYRRKLLNHISRYAAKYDLAVSRVSIYEIFRREKITTAERQFFTRLFGDRNIPVLDLPSEIITNAWILCRCAHPKMINGNSKKDITGDMLIGGTVISNSNGLLLTSDRKEFAAPFWELIDKKLIVWDHGDRYYTQTLYLLKFNPCALDPEFLSPETLEECRGQLPLLLPPPSS